MEGSTFSI